MSPTLRRTKIVERQGRAKCKVCSRRTTVSRAVSSGLLRVVKEACHGVRIYARETFILFGYAPVSPDISPRTTGPTRSPLPNSTIPTNSRRRRQPNSRRRPPPLPNSAPATAPHNPAQPHKSFLKESIGFPGNRLLLLEGASCLKIKNKST